jgi:hypothetical protein
MFSHEASIRVTNGIPLGCHSLTGSHCKSRPNTKGLGIRNMQFGEGLHGVDAQCGAVVGESDEFGPRTGCPTSYPSGIGEGATFNKSLWLAVGEVLYAP